MTRLLILITTFILLGPPSGFAAGTIDPHVAARQKINLSGRQRMLSQRMAAQACVAMMSAEPAPHLAAVQRAHDDFATALAGLAEGDIHLNLTDEPDATIRAALYDVGVLWAEFGPAVLQVASQDMHTIVIAQLIELNLPVLKSSNAAVQLFVERYGAGVIDPDMARTIDLAGRQRMLSQRMMKEACFVAAGFASAQNIDALAASIAAFTFALRDLRHGNAGAGIVPPPNVDIAAQLDHVQHLAEPFMVALSLLDQDTQTARARLPALADQSTQVLTAMHHAVQLYVAP